MEHGFVNVNSGRIYYESSGTGLPVVFIHAGFLDSRMWDMQFASFSGKYKVIRYDVRGFGKSSVPNSPYSDASDLKMLLDALGIPNAVLVGVSNGGRIAFDFSVEYPEMVAGLIPFDFVIKGYESSGPEEDELVSQFDSLEENYKNLVENGKLRDAAAIDVDMWASRIPKDKREWLLDIAQENVLREQEDWQKFQNSPEPLAFKRLNVLTMPVIMILGDRDLPGIIMQVKRVHETLKGSKLMILEGADHIPSLSKTEEFNSILESILHDILISH